MIYLGIPDKDEQRSILRAMTRKIPLAPDYNEDDVVVRCPANMTGADFYALCSTAMMQSMKRLIEAQGTSSAIEPSVTAADFSEALNSLSPSVPLAEVKRYEALRRQIDKKQ